MNTDDAAAVQAKVDMLAKIFKGRLHVRYQKLNETFALCQADSANEEHWTELHRLLQSLGGAAGSFGFDELGARATFIELHVKDMLGQPKDPAEVAGIGAALAALQSTR